MFTHQVEFPKFVPDQLLTSSDLNNMFGYLDEQNRLTRTNLIGIGIVCGLQLKINAALTEVVITKGCGVTSAGYLITFEGNEAFPYKKYKRYDVETPRVYEKFYKTVGTSKVPIEVWELRNTAADADWLDLGPSFLSDKVILLFVELKEEDNKNCDPNSCDDKGINVTVSFLPMAVSKADAGLLLGPTGGGMGINTYTTLPEMRMKRWDVPNTTPVYSQDIFEGYFKLLDKPFIDKVETTLSNIYAVFGTTVAPSYSSNPFQGLSENLKFLYDGSINANQLVHLQYYYDFFSDLFLAYQEFRNAGTLVMSTCCPDEDLFPRHLLLGEVTPSANSGLLAYRHYFIYSPLFDQKGMLSDLRSLFKRLTLMVDQLFLPPVSGVNTKEDTFLRITPSMLWDVPLSVKAIPYYYRVNVGAGPLYHYWNAQRTLLNDATRNLSYHAAQYNAVDDFVTNPLRYDLEPYNFLRVEGIVGKPYVHVLKQVKQQIQKNRLPIDIIALSTDLGAVLNKNEAAYKRDATGMLEMLCHFQDLESMYDSLKSEILCKLCKELKYYYDFTFALFANFIRKQTVAGEVSQVPLFDVCSKGYVIKDKSLGMMIEFLYRKGLTDETLTIESFFEALGLNVDDVNNDDVPDGLNTQMTTLYMVLLNFFRIPLGIIRLSTLLTDDLDEFDEKAYCNASEKLSEYAKSLKAIFGILTANQKADLATGGKKTNPDGTTRQPGTDTNPATGTDTQVRVNALASNRVLANLATTGNGLATILLLIFMIEDFMDHLDELIYSCRCGALKSLKRDFLSRYLAVSRLRQFGYFTKMHPGIQHKAGVPMGGTFIVVYHSRKRRVIRNPTVGIRSFAAAPSAENNGRFVANETASIRRTTQVGGVVTDESNAPILGASVTVAETGEGATTNAQGIFKFTSSVVPYTLVVEAPGFEGYEEVKTDDDTKIQIRLGTFDGNPMDEISPGTVIADFYLPYRCCSDCPPIQYIINDKTPTTPPNNGPIANAGPDQEITLPINQVTLNGSGSSDADGTITSFQWAKLSGPNDPAFSTATSAQTDLTNLVQGVYLIELTVTDNGGSIARDTVQVTVNPPLPPENKPPVADAGPDQTVTFIASTATSVILDGSLSKDEDGTIVAFKWSQVSGPSNANIASSTLVQTPVTGFQQLGVYVFQLLVTDNQGATGQDTVTITLVPRTNQPPVANAGNDQTVTLSPTNNIVTLNGSASTDPDGDPLSFEWKSISGPTTPAIADPTKVQTAVSGFTSGKYEFALTVNDGKGGVAGDTVSVNVIMQEQPQKECGPLADIVAAIDDQNNYPHDLPKFQEAFQYYEEVMAYFKELGTKQGESSDKHLEFFSTPFRDQSTPELIIKWLTELNNKFILEGGDLRKVALLFYRIINLLSMYIVCIQKEDFDVAKVPMNRVFSMIQSHLKAWGPQVQAGAFDTESMEWLKRIAEDVKKEVGRVAQNGETSTKAKYFKVLQTILSLLEAML